MNPPKQAFALFFILFCNYSFGCSCIGKFKIRNEIAKHELIFSGKVLSKNEFPVEDSLSGIKLWNVEYEFEVKYIYKGEIVTDKVKVITGLGNGDCGFNFVLGKTYIVYSDFDDELISGEKRLRFVTTDICTRTQEYSAKEDKKIRRIVKRKCKDTSGNTA